MRLVFDIEGNGLYDTIDKIWCICAKDVDTGATYEWYRAEKPNSCNSILDILSMLSSAEELIGHNIINFDLPVLKKITGWRPDEDTKISDTLVMSRLANPDRLQPAGYAGKAGPHSLEAWGYRIGKGKLHHEEWDVFSADMLSRCRQDVEINRVVYHTISSELEDFTEETIQLEHDIARIITEQEHYGIRFDYERAKEYVKELTDKINRIDREIIPQLPKEIKTIGTTILSPFKKNGELKKQVTDYIEKVNEDKYRLSNVPEGQGREGDSLQHISSLWTEDTIGGPFTRLQFDDFNAGSTERIKNYLLSCGWKPESWNISKTTGERTSPKLEGAFKGISGELPKAIKDRITWRHRRSQIEGWIENATRTNSTTDAPIFTLRAGANSCGTNTGRMRHQGIVNIPRADIDKKTGELIWDTENQKSVFGTQMRSLFIPRDGYKIVGHDASGLELRMLAHYMNDPEFIDQILNGDIHTYNQEKAGLPTRDDAKTFIYALIYGAGDAKIGSIVGGEAAEGKLIKAEYFGQLPKLKAFIEKVKRASGQGYLRGLDGRRIWMRKDEYGRLARSKAVNTLLQAAGAIVMKHSCRVLWADVKAAQIEAHKVLDMHDEGQSEVLDSQNHIEPYCELAVKSIVEAGEHFKLNIPLDAEAKVGMNLAETH